MYWIILIFAVGSVLVILMKINKFTRSNKLDPNEQILAKRIELDDLFIKVKNTNEFHKNQVCANSSFTILKDNSTQIEVDFQKMLLIETCLDLNCGYVSEYWLRNIENKWVIFLYSQKIWTSKKMDTFEYSVKYSRVNKEPLEKYLKAIHLPFDFNHRKQDLLNRMKGIEIDNKELSKMISKSWEEYLTGKDPMSSGFNKHI